MDSSPRKHKVVGVLHAVHLTSQPAKGFKRMGKKIVEALNIVDLISAHYHLLTPAMWNELIKINPN